MSMNHLLGNCKRGRIFIVSAPAGTGKTTLIQMLTHEFSCVVQSVSYTTRPIRPGEISGIHYNFISKEAFKAKIASGDFLEHVELYQDYYGTSSSWVEDKLSQGMHVVLTIDTQGALKLQGKCDAVYIFLMPPSLKTLKDRLLNRNTETSEAIEKRLAWAEKEIAIGQKEYDYIIINQDLNIAYQALRSVFIAEEHRAKYFQYQGA